MNNWEKLLYLNKKLLTSQNNYLRLKLEETGTEFEKDILLCVEKMVSEGLSVKGWVLYDNPIEGGLYCFSKKYLGSQKMHIDFEIIENTDYLKKRYAVPCVTINTAPIMFNTIKELLVNNMHLKHDAGNFKLQ